MGEIFCVYFSRIGKGKTTCFLVRMLLMRGTAKLKVLTTSSQWFGVTYKADRPAVVERLNKLIADGVYPQYLWK